MGILTADRAATISLLIILLGLISTAGFATELEILLGFRSKLSDPVSLSSWRADANHCNFSGITCDSSGAVERIYLSGMNLTGPLPVQSLCSLRSLKFLSLGFNSFYGPLHSDLNNCSSLKSLDLASNSLSGAVPDFSSLRRLQQLNLSSNAFSGEFPWSSLRNLTELFALSLGDNPDLQRYRFPEEILLLKNLTWLYLTNSSLEGEIPHSIGNLTSLLNLEMSYNFLDGLIPPEIGNLVELRQLELWGNHLSGLLPVGFGKLKKLQYFDGSMNLLEGDLTEIKNLTKLVSLQLYENGFSGNVPSEIGEFKDLVNLSLYSNNLTGTLPSTIGRWSEFVYIDVSNNFLTGPIPQDMCKNGKMQHLLILGNNFTGGIPTTYAGCKSLVRLRVGGNSLSGAVPYGIWGLPNLEIIELAGNGFDGPVTSDISGAEKLSELSILNNKFSGELPEEIFQIKNLNKINAGFNEFSGLIPYSIGEAKSLGVVLLPGNKLSGRIPDSLSSCTALQQIDLSGNSMSGPIPPSLGSLPSLNSLNLSHNQLSGPIPESISALKLSVLDLSVNQLSGTVPDGLSLGAYGDAFSGNPALCSSKIQYLRRCSSNLRGILASCFAAGVILILASFSGYLCIKKRRQNCCSSSGDRDFPTKISWDLKSFRSLSFTEHEILNSIKKENLIGKGGSGNVYKVNLGNGQKVAVKHVWNSGPGEDRTRKSSSAMLRRPKKTPEFDAEVSALSSIRHVNVVQLYCSISSEDSNLLVYEYLPNGSLWDRLHGDAKAELDWWSRYEIAVGAAKGLEYLHHGCERPVIHRDVKSSNILLDEFLKPRIADFGLAKIVQTGTGSGKDSTQVVAGTYGYIAPEYAYTWKVNEKSDVYSFGVVLMELVTGKRPIESDFGENRDIVFWVSTRIINNESVVELVDPEVPVEAKDYAAKVLRIALLCTAKLPALRPSMRGVVQLLEAAAPWDLVTIPINDEKARESFKDNNNSQK